MNAHRISQFKDIISNFSNSQRKVLPVVNTCLDNITAASENMDANNVGRVWVWQWVGFGVGQI